MMRTNNLQRANKVFKRIATSGKLILCAIGICILFGCWEVVSSLHLIGPTLIASPKETAYVLHESIIRSSVDRENVFFNLKASLMRCFTGWMFGVVIGTGVGTIMAAFPLVFQLASPIIEFLRATPPILLFPIFLIKFDQHDSAFWATIALGIIPTVVISISSGLKQANTYCISVLRVYRVGPFRLALALIMELLPFLFLTARISFNMALIITVVTETVQSPVSGWGIGNLVRDAGTDYNTPVVFACIITVAAVGVVVDTVLRAAESFTRGGSQIS